MVFMWMPSIFTVAVISFLLSVSSYLVVAHRGGLLLQQVFLSGCLTMPTLSFCCPLTSHRCFSWI